MFLIDYILVTQMHIFYNKQNLLRTALSPTSIIHRIHELYSNCTIIVVVVVIVLIQFASTDLLLV